ncbi:hypothetical protein [Flavobacterium cellulosilyticum]|uniref:Uncharacterized protein n=1 Tax=Flavobacterium cellulosilyticum TaxID=2541731 RepID=A0A4R5C7J1_9FLAO|nr:hypothetical protein [Flavobacterium cellulosilyticum]TDD95075.1 hypothetical protein E0F76_14950 [Flavobacterium cellulosilyticum]
MNITYYLAGLLSGICVASFFIGKELYKFYIKNKIQKKQLDRMAKLNDKIKKSFYLESNEMSSYL